MSESAVQLVGIFVGLIGALIPIYVSNHKASKHDKEQTLAILRLTVMNSEMPISERLIAGQKYINKGGNGDVKKYYEKLCQEHLK
mgnify:CR=1 FL=1